MLVRNDDERDEDAASNTSSIAFGREKNSSSFSIGAAFGVLVGGSFGKSRLSRLFEMVGLR